MYALFFNEGKLVLDHNHNLKSFLQRASFTCEILSRFLLNFKTLFLILIAITLLQRTESEKSYKGASELENYKQQWLICVFVKLMIILSHSSLVNMCRLLLNNPYVFGQAHT